MRISDWSSDVCSSDLDRRRGSATDRNSFPPFWPHYGVQRLCGGGRNIGTQPQGGVGAGRCRLGAGDRKGLPQSGAARWPSVGCRLDGKDRYICWFYPRSRSARRSRTSSYPAQEACGSTPGAEPDNTDERGGGEEGG